MKEFNIGELLKEIENEITVAAQALFAWKSIHNVASEDESIKEALNENALSWNICLHSLQTTFFISIGRIFDTNPQSCSIHLLFRQCIKSIEAFNRSSLRERKIEEAGGIERENLNTYIEKAYEPQISDFRKLKKNISRAQKIYEQKFRPVRHNFFAHNDSDNIPKKSEHFSGATIDEAEDILNTLYKVVRVIWSLYTNGHEMNYEYWELNEESYILRDIETLLKKI